VYPMLPVSLDCPFSLPLRYSLTCICPVSCVPNVASFSLRETGNIGYTRHRTKKC
jgi:hypothetical protein